jgi:hypothetical protein
MQALKESARFLGIALTLPLTSACGEAPSELGHESSETTASTAEAIGEASCLLASSDGRLSVGEEEASLISPTLYNHSRCSKAYVVQAEAAFPDSIANRYFLVGWADMWERNRSQCVNGKLAVQVMSRPAGGILYQDVETYERALHWDAERGECRYPTFGMFQEEDTWMGYWAINTPTQAWGELGFPLPRSLSGRQIKVAASARTPSGTTQPLRFFWTGDRSE